MVDERDPTITSKPYRADDEISLRELYLVLRRNVLLILGIPIVAAAAVFLVLRSGPNQYVSESVVVVTPPAISIEGARGLAFQPVSVRYETYEALALSNPVLLAVAAHPDVVAVAGETVSLRSIRAAVNLRQLAASNAPTVTVSHSVTWDDPNIATMLANTWAAEALDAVRASVLDSLGPVDQATRNEIDELAAVLIQAEAALEAFDGTALLELSRAQLDALSSRVTREELAIVELSGDIAAGEARLAALEDQLAQELGQLPATNPFSERYLAGLSFPAAIAFVEEQLGVVTERRNRARAELDAFDASHDLTGLERRLEALSSAVTNLQTQLDALPGQRRLAEQRIAAIEAELISQPLQLSVNSAQIVTVGGEANRLPDGTGASVWTLVNPAHLSLTEQLVDARLQAARFESEESILAADLTRMYADRDTQRRHFVTLQSERIELETAFEEANALLRMARTTLDALRVVENDPRSGTTVRSDSPVTLEIRSALRAQAVELEGARVELAERTAQLGRDRVQLAEARQSIASLEAERSQLARTVANSRSAYEDVAPLGPIIAYMTQLAPTTARVVANATPATDPQPRRSVLVATLAYVVTAFALVVLVLLREAVRDPDSESRAPSTRAEQAPSTRSDGYTLRPAHSSETDLSQ